MSVTTKCPVHGKPFLPEGKGLWEVHHLGCDYPSGPCDCWCGTYCRLSAGDAPEGVVNMSERIKWKEREDRAKKYWHEHQLSYDGPTPEPWETMAAFARLEINRTLGESSRAPEGSQ